MQTLPGQKEVSLLVSFRKAKRMQKWYLGWEKVLDVFSFQGVSL